MKNEQQLQAKNLYFQTNLTKTQIAELLNVNRRTIHYWIREGNWDRLKKSATHLPSLIAENCYHILAHLTDNILSEYRIMKPVTREEAETMHKLTLTINKLKNRSTLNESMEMFAYFIEGVKAKAPELAEEIMPHVDAYISSRASVFANHVMPEHFNEQRRIPAEEDQLKERQLDIQDEVEWRDANLPVMNVYESDLVAAASEKGDNLQETPARDSDTSAPHAANSTNGTAETPASVNNNPQPSVVINNTDFGQFSTSGNFQTQTGSPSSQIPAAAA